MQIQSLMYIFVFAGILMSGNILLWYRYSFITMRRLFYAVKSYCIEFLKSLQITATQMIAYHSLNLFQFENSSKLQKDSVMKYFRP